MSRRQRKMTRTRKQEEGFERVVDKKPTMNTGWTLGWFQPEGDQHLIIDSMSSKPLTVVQAPSGTGKSTTVLWKALSEYAAGEYKKIYLIKNPTECGDDLLGFLKGELESKLSAHIESMKGIFHQFMTKEKLQNDVSAGNIVITIPNYLLGATIDNSIIIIEEAQTMSPNTIKLITERCGMDSKVVIVGDPKQTYSVKKRPDGLADLVSRVTRQDGYGNRYSKHPSIVGYIKMTSSNNMRSELSRFITDLYEEG